MYVGVALIVVFIDFLACFNNIYFYSYKNNYKKLMFKILNNLKAFVTFLIAFFTKKLFTICT